MANSFARLVLAASLILGCTSFRAASAEIGVVAFIDIIEESAAVSADYKKMLLGAVKDELHAMGLSYVNPQNLPPASANALKRVLHVALGYFQEATRVEVTLYRYADNAELFQEAIYLPAGAQDRPAQRLFNDIPLLRKKFTGRIRQLYLMHREDSNKPRLFADCIFPSTSAEKDWADALFVTTTYPAALQANAALSSYRIFGISKSAFSEWCKIENPNQPIPFGSFEVIVSGQTYGTKVLLSYQYGNSLPIHKMLSIPPDLEGIPQAIGNTVIDMVK
jgi:hypothetical protein